MSNNKQSSIDAYCNSCDAFICDALITFEETCSHCGTDIEYFENDMSNNKQSSVDKEFVPYEQALVLKELGFDETCLSYYEGESFSYHLATMTGGDDYIIPAPLYQQAFRWFRDKKLSDACICRYQSRDDGGIYFYYVINHDYGVEETKHYEEGFSSYEQAELACLRKLIEIVQGGNK